MELLYIWINDYKVIKQQGFNFSPKYRFNFDLESSSLDITVKDYYPDQFFGENIVNVSAIVGENGAGKSTLLEYLLSVCFTSNNYLYDDFIAAWRIDGEGGDKVSIHYGNHFINELNINVQEVENLEIEQKVYDQEEVRQRSTLERYHNPYSFIHKFFYSNSVDQRPFYFRGFNLSTDFLLRGGETHSREIDQLQVQNTRLHPARLHYILDLKRQIDYVSSGAVLPFQLPEEIIITPSNLNLSDILSLDLPDDIKRSINFLLHRINFEVPSLSRSVLAEFWESVLAYIIKKEIHRNEDYDVNAFLDSIDFSDSGFDQSVLSHLTIDEDDQRVMNFINAFLNFSASLDQIPPNPNRRGSGYWRVQSENWSSLFDLLDEYPFAIDFLIFSWDLPSTGEIAFLKLFSRFYSCRDRVRPNYPILILLDEAETGLHPNWQRKLNSYIFKFLSELFPTNKIQIILTSHSPFVLSDLPKENVIFLRKGSSGRCEVITDVDKMKHTFSSNIHTLLSNAFFLESLMGEFAKTKVNQVNEYVKGNAPLDLQYVEFITEIIGEPIIKRYLTNVIQRRRNEEEQLKLRAEIQTLKDELDQYKTP